ncbi:MAG: hypothetical protein LBE21_04810 [Pseudomonadales bacterium]|jgi:hypothetical protein|nr:hypothetical protein [Pseudomonadales bacterium]
MDTIREQITKAAKALGIEDGMKLVAPHRYQAILERIMLNRTTLSKSAVAAAWWWEALREPVAYMNPPLDTLATLKALVNSDEPVWFVVEADSPKKQGNFWLYESTIEPICAVLQALPFVEYYVVARKMQWLICENHHNQLIASGEPMASKLERLRA